MWYIILFSLVIIVDQVTKILCASFSGQAGQLTGGGVVTLKVVIEDLFHIEYCENVNGAMGIFRDLPNAQTIFIVITIIVLVFLAIYLLFNHAKSKWVTTSLILIMSGAIGNFIDRVTTVYVRDMIHVIINFKGKELFPYIFNVADIAVCVGGGMLILYLLILDDDALLISEKKKAQRKQKRQDKLDRQNAINQPIPLDEI